MKNGKLFTINFKSFVFLAVLLILIAPSLFAQVYFSDDFENGLGKWEVSGHDWDTTAVDYRSGNYCVTESEGGNFQPNANSMMTMKYSINLSTSDSPVLRFWHKISVPDGPWDDDHGYVEISENGGGNWSVLKDFRNVIYATWYFAQFDLSAYKLNSILIRFRLRADGDGDTGDGWKLDDVEIIEKDKETFQFPFIEDFENGLGKWMYGPEWEIISNDFYNGNHSITESASGNFVKSASSALITLHPIDLSNTISPVLRFWHKISVADGPWDDDHGYVYVSQDAGTTWELVINFYNVIVSSWSYTQVDLSRYKNSQVLFMFRLRADGDDDLGDGWKIDNVEIKEKDTDTIAFPFFDDFEHGFDSWLKGPEWDTTYVDYRSAEHCITESKNGNFKKNASSTILLKYPIDISQAVSPVLKYWHKIYVPDGPWGDDHGRVYVSQDSGTTWIKVKDYNNINISSWTLETIPLDTYKSTPILIRFTLRADGDNDLGDGWLIDDVEIKDSSNDPPIIDSLTANPSSGQPPLPVNLVCGAHDQNGTITKFEWDFDGDGTVDKITSIDPPVQSISDTARHTYNLTGVYQASCTVYDDINAISSETVTIYVSADTGRVVIIPDTSVSAGETFEIPIQISNIPGIAGAEFKVTFDSNILTAQGAVGAGFPDTFVITDSTMPGKIAISMARHAGSSVGTGNLVGIKFQVNPSAKKGDTTSIVLASVALYDENTNPISAVPQNGLFTVSDGGGSGQAVELFISPISDTINVNETIAFQASGKDGQGNAVTVSPTWKVVNMYGEIGTIAPATGAAATFTSIGPGDGLVIIAIDSLALADTAVVVVGKTRGDVNIDDKVNVQDAILCLQIIVNKFTPFLYQSWAADYDGSGGKPNSGDAIGILKESLEGLLPKVFAHSGSGPASVQIGQIKKNSNGILTVPVLIQDRTDICGTDLQITFNHYAYTLMDVSPAVGSALMAKNADQPGHASISLVNLDGIVNSEGRLLTLQFKANENNDVLPKIVIEQISLFDRSAKPIDVNITSVQERIVQLPEIFQLHQNYPNPFNPSTMVRYDLPKSNRVNLIIYNTNGQQVRILVNGEMSAGSHSAVWDARDDAGQIVPAGVYFYKLCVDNGSWQKTKKMILIK